MGSSRKLVRDLLLLPTKPYQQSVVTTLPNRQFSSIFTEFSDKIKGEANSNPEFKKSVEQLKNKADDLKRAKEDLRLRTCRTTEKLYKQVDGVWTEAEATANKVSASVKEKISAVKDKFKESFGNWKQESSKSSEGSKTASGQERHKQSEPSDAREEAIFGKFKSTISSASPAVSLAFEKLNEAKVIHIAKKGYGVLKDEISGTTGRRKQIQYEPSTVPKSEISTRTEITIVPQSHWNKKWETLKGRLQGYTKFKPISGFSDHVSRKTREIIGGLQDGWETSDNPVVDKVKDVIATVLGESVAAETMKEIRHRDPWFSLPDILKEVQDIIGPVLNAYAKGDAKTLKKYCSPEVIQRCVLEREAYQSQGIFFDNKILHISDAEKREEKMMGSNPLIIVGFQTQQVYCVRDKHGNIVEGSEDTIHTVHYKWALQQVPPEELGEGAFRSMFRLREIQQIGVQALI